MNQLVNSLSELIQTPIIRAGVILAVALLASLFARVVLFRIILKLTGKTRSAVDDELILAIRAPIIYSLVLAGVAWSIACLELKPALSFVFLGLIKTAAVFIWGKTAMRVGSIFLEIMSRNRERLLWIQPKTQPLLQIVWKVLVFGGIFYFLFVSWHINPTSWIASAGIVGIAVGFAAKDTLANLFAGIFIVADAPYKIGDFVILDGGLRGEITEIGIRSSRLLTRDDIEVTVPNALIANGTIVNETGGPHQKMRVRVKVDVAYGSDVDRVREILLSCVEGVEHVVTDPEPRVRFRAFGGSGLCFELLVWIDMPVFRGRVLDGLNVAVYKSFNAAGIEIPYTKQDVYVKEMPTQHGPSPAGSNES
ncbi:MAG: mechanosensitive ion channel family protein [Candidatus Eisenbacteria sp.]|nr:mechanosensitive ion channel family protein [Candidatus Eisenbacteria bacterium]